MAIPCNRLTFFPEQLRGDLKYFDRCFELPTSFLRLGQPCSIRRDYPGSFALINLILAHPFMKFCCAHAELLGRGRDGFAGSHERECSQAELGGEWSWYR